MDLTPPALEPLQAALGDRYRLERELGGGGMARVFLATETALERRVVIKLLSDALAAGLSAERFAREIRLAAQLQDPHIVPVLSTGATSDGIPYYTMPFVPGDSLRARLQAGPVPPDDAIRILRDIAEALEYAHAQGVVHRDIKPENILLSSRTAVVTDFGIAKAITAARGEEAAAGATLTSVGVSLGTPAYMAPEQATGDTVDHRADLYAWGLLAYELLAGAHPFAGKTSTQQLVTAQITEQPAPLDTKRPGLPLPLAALVMQCLEKEPVKRPADATAVLTALAALGSGAGLAATTGGTTSGTSAHIAPSQRSRPRTLVLGATFVGLLVATGAWITMRGGDSRVARAAADTATPGLVVLPFEHQGDSTDVYLTEGITDEIRSKLSTVRDLVVIARSSAVQYRGTAKPPRQIAEELGVRWLLTGTVQVIGTGDTRRVIVRPELVEITAAGQPQSRWSAPFDVQGADVLGLQGQVATRVVDAIALPGMSADRPQLVAVPTRDPVAYDLLLKARAATNFGSAPTAANLQRAEQLLTEAVARDSLFLDGWSDLATARSNLFRGRPSAALASSAKEAAERALALDPDGALGARAMAAYLRIVANEPARALSEAERAFRADPADARMATNVSNSLLDAGRIDEGLRALETAQRLDPRSVPTLALTVQRFLQLGRLGEARAMSARLAIVAPPTSSIVMIVGIYLELASGDSVAAKRIVAEALATDAAENVVQALIQDPSRGWLLDRPVRDAAIDRVVRDAPPDERPLHRLLRAEYAWMDGDTARARLMADSVRPALARLGRPQPGFEQPRLQYASALALTGRRAEAVQEVRATLDTWRATNGGQGGSSSRSALFIYAAVNALAAGAPDVALDLLEEERRAPLHHSANELRLDPSFRLLRGHPRFEALIRHDPPR